MYKNLWEKRKICGRREKTEEKRKNRGAEELWSVAGKEKMLRGKRGLNGFISQRKRRKSGLVPIVTVHAQRVAH